MRWPLAVRMLMRAGALSVRRLDGYSIGNSYAGWTEASTKRQATTRKRTAEKKTSLTATIQTGVIPDYGCLGCCALSVMALLWHSGPI
ncbi:MAG: hypothetical protein M1415_03315 [Firmicutes bacterium]|nr:hypothetical protein [Bacillota bacterium]